MCIDFNEGVSRMGASQSRPPSINIYLTLRLYLENKMSSGIPNNQTGSFNQVNGLTV